MADAIADKYFFLNCFVFHQFSFQYLDFYFNLFYGLTTTDTSEFLLFFKIKN